MIEGRSRVIVCVSNGSAVGGNMKYIFVRLSHMSDEMTVVVFLMGWSSKHSVLLIVTTVSTTLKRLSLIKGTQARPPTTHDSIIGHYWTFPNHHHYSSSLIDSHSTFTKHIFIYARSKFYVLNKNDLQGGNSINGSRCSYCK
jgi:hypothetical protein